MENEQELLDSQNQDDGTEDTKTYTQEEVDAMIEAKTSKLYARAKVAETKLKERHEAKPEISTPKADDTLWELADYIREGYSRDEVEFVRANGGKEALKDPNSLVSLALRAKAEQRKAEIAASQATDTTQYTDSVMRKYPQEELKKMSAAELAKILPHAD